MIENSTIPPYPQPGSTQLIILHNQQIPDRLDRVITQHIPALSRSSVQKLIEKTAVTVNGTPAQKPGLIVKAGDQISITFPIVTLSPSDKIMPLGLEPTIVFEHEHFLIIDKPAGLAVHKPHADAIDYTLVDWLLNTFHDIANVGSSDRPGIVHRLDKNTSGLMIVARNNYAHALFGDMFKHRTISKTYQAIVTGHPATTGSIDLPIGRDAFIPTKMSCRDGRSALTHYKVMQYFDNAAFVEAYPITGRTHQIRVHFSALGNPLLGDVVYGSKSPLIPRHALHAAKLAFTFDNRYFSFESPLAQDMQTVLENLETSKS